MIPVHTPSNAIRLPSADVKAKNHKMKNENIFQVICQQSKQIKIAGCYTNNSIIKKKKIGKVYPPLLVPVARQFRIKQCQKGCELNLYNSSEFYFLLHDCIRVLFVASPQICTFFVKAKSSLQGPHFPCTQGDRKLVFFSSANTKMQNTIRSSIIQKLTWAAGLAGGSTSRPQNSFTSLLRVANALGMVGIKTDR